MLAWSVWGIMGTLLQQEGAEPRVSSILYGAVVQAVLLHGSETWVLSAEMERKMEGIHTEFLRRITGKRARQLRDGTWDMPGAEGVRETSGTQSARTYIWRRQENVAQWMVLRPIFEVCARDTWYEGGGCRRGARWCQEEKEKQLWGTLASSREAKRRRSSGENGMQ